jgi:activator of HSP90 ATPase
VAEISPVEYSIAVVFHHQLTLAVATSTEIITIQISINTGDLFMNSQSNSALSNLRNVRLSLQKQEQVLVQKFHSDTLNQITKLLNDADLTIEDLNHHMNAIKFSANKMKRLNKKANHSPASTTSSTPTSAPTSASASAPTSPVNKSTVPNQKN